MQQLPRTAFTRAAGLRVPSTSFRRWNSTEGGDCAAEVDGVGVEGVVIAVFVFVGFVGFVADFEGFEEEHPPHLFWVLGVSFGGGGGSE